MILERAVVKPTVLDNLLPNHETGSDWSYYLKYKTQKHKRGAKVIGLIPALNYVMKICTVLLLKNFTVDGFKVYHVQKV